MNEKVVCQNKKAWHDYFIENSYEAGIVLQGTEVKSLREGKANLKDSYAKVKKGEIFLINFHISPYSHGNIMNHEPLRERKLLLHKREIKRIISKTEEKGYALIPLKIYFKNGKAKVELGIAKGKKLYDKRESIKKRDDQAEIAKMVKYKNR